MDSVSVVGPDDGEVIDLGPARLRILEGGGTTVHRLAIVEITLSLFGQGPPQHVHAEHDEGFCVVSGTAGFTGSVCAVLPGSAGRARRGGEPDGRTVAELMGRYATIPVADFA